MSYRMQALSREEMAAADPFGGRGVFLAAPGAESAEMLRRLASCLGITVPAVAWDDTGVWADPGSTGMSAESVRNLWDGGGASERG